MVGSAVDTIGSSAASSIPQQQGAENQPQPTLRDRLSRWRRGCRRNRHTALLTSVTGHAPNLDSVHSEAILSGQRVRGPFNESAAPSTKRRGHDHVARQSGISIRIVIKRRISRARNAQTARLRLGRRGSAWLGVAHRRPALEHQVRLGLLRSLVTMPCLRPPRPCGPGPSAARSGVGRGGPFPRTGATFEAPAAVGLEPVARRAEAKKILELGRAVFAVVELAVVRSRPNRFPQPGRAQTRSRTTSAMSMQWATRVLRVTVLMSKPSLTRYWNPPSESSSLAAATETGRCLLSRRARRLRWCRGARTRR